MILDFILHFDQHLATFIQAYGNFAYGVLFLIIFCESGIILLPFFPGDSLLFALGALSAKHLLEVHVVTVLLFFAGFLGENFNYWLGRWFGHAFLSRFQGKFIQKKHIDQTHAFYEKHGAYTIIFARFLPIIRTFSPFIAGIAEMSCVKYILFSVIGNILWIGGLIYIGFLFGNISFVQENFMWAILAIMLISALPMVIGYFRHR